MKPLVSAIIPCFNYGRFVGRAIESVLNQTYENLECIVIDDGSTDQTAEVLTRFNDRVHVISQPHRGVSAARNAGIALAQGEFIAFLDGDDWWHPAKIEHQVAAMLARPELGAIGCGLEHIYPDGTAERIAGRTNTDDRVTTHRKIALRRFWIMGSGSGTMVRRSVLDRVGPFDEQLVAAEDWDMWLRVAALSQVDNVAAQLVSINRHGTGIFRNAGLMEANQRKVFERIMERWPELLGIADQRRLKALILADAARESRVRADAMSYYFRSLREWPFNYKRLRAAAVLTLRSLQALLQRRDAAANI